MKKLSTLHILNGDASLPAFKAAQLPGQVLIWREILSEGPVAGALPEHGFWELRQQYITAADSEAAAQYAAKVLDELPKLWQAHLFFEVVLWFDADLMCQVNVLYLLQELARQEVKVISLCSPAPFGQIGLLPVAEAEVLFESRRRVTAVQLQQARALWDLYAGPDPLQLQAYLQESETDLPHLKQALALHFSRFPNCNTGLSAPQHLLLALVQQGATALQPLMKEFWLRHPPYGYGDLQLQNLLRQLQPALISLQEPYTLTPFGQKILENSEKYLEWLEKKPYLGGYRLQTGNYLCYDPEAKKLSVPQD